MKYLKYFEQNTNIYNNKLTSLKDLNISKKIYGHFDCDGNYLTSLEFGPEYVGGYFSCSHNKLTSLEFCPETINNHFFCNNNELTSLEFGPKIVKGSFYCSYNKLTSLEFCPEIVGENFICNNNNWTNPIPYNIMLKYNLFLSNLYTFDQKKKFRSYKFQKEFLTNTPEKYKDLEVIGYHTKIKEEFDWLFNASDMGLM